MKQSDSLVNLLPKKVLDIYSDTWLPDRLISERWVSSRFSILLNCLKRTTIKICISHLEKTRMINLVISYFDINHETTWVVSTQYMIHVLQNISPPSCEIILISPGIGEFIKISQNEPQMALENTNTGKGIWMMVKLMLLEKAVPF